MGAAHTTQGVEEVRVEVAQYSMRLLTPESIVEAAGVWGKLRGEAIVRVVQTQGAEACGSS